MDIPTAFNSMNLATLLPAPTIATAFAPAARRALVWMGSRSLAMRRVLGTAALPIVMRRALATAALPIAMHRLLATVTSLPLTARLPITAAGVVLIALAVGTGPEMPVRICESEACGPRTLQAAAFPQRVSAPEIPLQGPGVPAPVPLVLPIPALAESQAWANSAAPIPPRPKPKVDNSFAGAMRNMGRSLSMIFR